MTSNSSGSGKRALVTGITGQDGSYLAELLLAKGYEVWGLARRSSTETTDRIDHLVGGPSPAVRLVWGDLSDSLSLAAALEVSRPHEVYNLAAQSHVGISFDMPEYTADVGALGTLRLLEAIRATKRESRFYQASSSELYGRVVETPQSETTPFHPRSPYAVAKAFAFHITRNYREAYGMFAVNGILFNHESPRRGIHFVTRKITRAVARIHAGLDDCVRLGNLEARRDWGFAGDYVEAMWRMLQADEPDDFVVATGETRSVREFCELAFAHAGMPIEWRGQELSEVGVDERGRELVRIDPRFFRPAEVDLLRGDPTKARESLGWEPRVDFEELVRRMVDADLERLAGRPVADPERV